MTDDERLVLRGLEPKAVFTSAHTGEGIDELLERIAQLLPTPSIRLELLVPYDHGEVISALHEHGRILDTAYVEGGTMITALVTEQQLAQLQDTWCAAVGPPYAAADAGRAGLRPPR